jgi:mono/diheme cytochrome c family protein
MASAFRVATAFCVATAFPLAAALPWATALLWSPVLTATTADATESEFDAVTSYERLCAECHGKRRYGGYSPPLIPATLARKQDEALVGAILKGLPNTQMPAFAGQLDESQARALVTLLREAPSEFSWSLSDIQASRKKDPATGAKIPPEIRRENLVLVVERGSGSVVVLDGDTLTELDRFGVGRIHGGIKFDRGLHQALAVTRDGTLVDYDLDKGEARTRIKVGINTRNIAVATEGEFVVAANQLPQGLVVMDGRLRPLSLFPLPGQPSAVYQVPGSRRFLLTLRDLPQLYFLDYPDLELHKVELAEPFEDFVFVPDRPQLIASSRAGQRLVLYDYDRRIVLGSIETHGLPHLFSASFFDREGVLHAAFNHMGAPRLSIIDLERFEIAKEVSLLGTGYFTRTHEATPYLWIDSNTESIQLVDKKSLELVETLLTPAPGKKAMHVEFTAPGDRAMVSVWDEEGAVVIYDSNTLAEVMRIPFAMPVGKYNALNKTRMLR